MELNKLLAYTVMDNETHDIPIKKDSARNKLQNVSNNLKKEKFNLNQESAFCKSNRCVYDFICKELIDGKN